MVSRMAWLTLFVAAACTGSTLPTGDTGTPPDTEDPTTDTDPTESADTTDSADTGPALVTVCFDEDTHFRNESLNHQFMTNPALRSPNSNTAPDYAPMADAPVLVGGAVPPDDGFFDPSATFVGAVGAEDWTQDWTAFPVDTAGPDQGTVTQVAGGYLTEATTWTTGNTYVLDGLLVVSETTLTIEPGVLVRGVGANAGIVVTQTGRLVADGTAENPIVMTSSLDEGADAGDWAGVVLLGGAPINVFGGSDTVDGLTEGGPYGGFNAAHDCGTLRYTRIEYAVVGLIAAGCGAGTTLDYVQVHRSDEDGMTFLGGSTNVRHSVVTGAANDGLSWDQGWTGKGQFLVVDHMDLLGDKGIEGASNALDPKALPMSQPTLYNVSLLGKNSLKVNAGAGALVGGGSGLVLRNFILAFFTKFAVDIEGESSAKLAQAGTLVLEHGYFFMNPSSQHWRPGFDNDTDGFENDCWQEKAPQ